MSEMRGVNLDELQREAERLVLLLKDREYGLATWNIALREQLQKLKELLKQAGV